MTKRTALTALLAGTAVTAAAAAAPTPWRAHQSTLRTITGGGQVTVADSGGRQGTVRVRYVLPAKWRRLTSLNARVLRLDTGNSCRHVVTLTPRLIQAADVPAADRAAALVPTSVPRAYGTREGAVFRVGRRRGSADVIGAVVQPLARRYSQGAPSGQRVYAEILATATPDPRRECHAGGPRGVADALGDSFASAGAVGGFVSTTP